MIPSKKEHIIVTETKKQISVISEDIIPEIYMPRLQLFVRFILVTITAAYLNFSPVSPLFLTLMQINIMVAGYFIFHLLWWIYYKKFGASIIMIRVGAWVDTTAAALALVSDPFIIPPTIGLLLIASLGNGIQHGFRIFIECMIGAFILGTVALIYHFILIGSRPPYHLYFYVFLIGFAIFYSYMLVRRLEQMKLEAVVVSEHDSLTGLLNRRAFLRTAEYLLLLNERTNIPLVFVFADLDHFKAVNDQFGHDMGDKALKYFSQIAKSELRKNDIIARYGGDEFVMILTDTTFENAESVLKRIKMEFGQWAHQNGLPVGVSFGMGTTLEGENKIEDVLRRVDAALYEEKRRQAAPDRYYVKRSYVNPSDSFPVC
jgi:diguanylate cyclase (GGDEF)-like protein